MCHFLNHLFPQVRFALDQWAIQGLLWNRRCQQPAFVLANSFSWPPAMSFQQALTFTRAAKRSKIFFFRDAQGNGWLSVQTDLRAAAAAAAVRQSWPANPCLSRPSDSQGELETQKRHHEAKLITTKEEEKHKMDKMALELELKWTETLRWAGVGRVWHRK